MSSDRRGARVLMLAVIVVATAVCAPHAVAQSAEPRAATSPGRERRDSVAAVAPDGAVWRSRDLVTLGAFTLATSIALNNDAGVARATQRPGLQDNDALRRTASLFRTIGQPGVLVGSVSAYAIGRLTHRPVLASAGLRVTEALLITSALTSAAKVAVGRTRPSATPTRDPARFEPWHGTRQGYTSMPSGHTSAAFATASALAVEWRTNAPRSARYAVPLLYTTAALVGASRVYNDRHWTSDVIAGAALGTLVGGAVARWSHAHPRNRVERWLVPVRVSPAGGGGVNVGVEFEAATARR